MSPSTQNKLNRVLSQVLGIPAESIQEESSPDTIPGWDSLSHLNLILSIESEFGISLTPEEAMEMLSVKLIRMILAEKGVESFDE